MHYIVAKYIHSKTSPPKPCLQQFMRHFINKVNLTAFFAIFYVICSYGQTRQDLLIPLQTVIGTGQFPQGYNQVYLYEEQNANYDSARHFTGIPTNVKEYIIKLVDFQPEQGMYESYLRWHGQMSPENLLKGLSSFKRHIDTLQLSRKPIKHAVYLISGIDVQGKRVIIVDANNNLNFGDDKVFVYDTALTINKDTLTGKPLSNNQTVYFQYARNGSVYNDSYNLLLSPYNKNFKYRKAIEERLKVMSITNEFRRGDFSIDKEKFRVEALSRDPTGISYDSLHTILRIETLDSIKRNGEKSFVLVGDTIAIHKSRYKIAGLTFMGDSVRLQYIGDGPIIYGIDSGTIAYTIQTQDIFGKPFNLSDYKGKYVLIDFWGTWCRPCVGSIPDLVKLANKYKNNLQVVSVALDAQENIPLIKTMIAEKKMNWIHLYQDDSEPTAAGKQPIISAYRVEHFPTQVLIDPNGLIVLRTTGDKGAIAVDQKLTDLIKVM